MGFIAHKLHLKLKLHQIISQLYTKSPLIYYFPNSNV